MRKTNVKILATALAVCSIFAVSGCDTAAPNIVGKSGMVVLTEENKDSVKYNLSKTYEYTDPATIKLAALGEDVMPIIGFWGPWQETYYSGSKIPNLQTSEMYAKIAESGVNVILQGNDGNNPDAMCEQLALCEENGISYLIQDHSLYTFSGSVDKDTSIVNPSQDAWNESVARFSQYKSFAGYFLEDECLTETLKSVGKAKTMLENAYTANGLDKTHYMALSNAFPRGYIGAYDKVSYSEHLDRWVSDAKSDVLSYDHYPFVWDGVDNLQSSLFYGNLREIYEAAKRNNRPWMACVQMGGNWTAATDGHSGVCPPTMEQMMWQANMLLAYGAKGYFYFTLCMPHSFFQYLPNDGVTGLFDPWGNKTKLYYSAKMVNDQVKAIDHVLMNATHLGIISTGRNMGEGKHQISTIITDGKFRELQGVNEDSTAMIGCFDYKGKTALFVMNGSYYDKTQIKLSFDDTYCYDITQRAQTVSVVAKTVTLNLDPGESSMIVLH